MDLPRSQKLESLWEFYFYEIVFGWNESFLDEMRKRELVLYATYNIQNEKED